MKKFLIISLASLSLFITGCGKKEESKPLENKEETIEKEENKPIETNEETSEVVEKKEKVVVNRDGLKHGYMVLDGYCDIGDEVNEYCTITNENYNNIKNKVFLELFVDNSNIVQDIEICTILGKGTNKEKLVCVSDEEEFKIFDSLKNDYNELRFEEDDQYEYEDKKIYVSGDAEYIHIMLNDENALANDDQCYLFFDEVGNIENGRCGAAN